ARTLTSDGTSVDRATNAHPSGGGEALPSQPALRHPSSTRGAHRRPPRAVSRRRTAFALAAVALLVIAACSGGKKKAAPTTTTTAAPSTTAPPPTYPLTGLPATDQNILKRPALVVKIDNADGGPGNTARPQLGLNEADVVYEEMVEGSVTRLGARRRGVRRAARCLRAPQRNRPRRPPQPVLGHAATVLVGAARCRAPQPVVHVPRRGRARARDGETDRLDPPRVRQRSGQLAGRLLVGPGRRWVRAVAAGQRRRRRERQPHDAAERHRAVRQLPRHW